MFEAQREQAILRTVAERGFASVQALTEHLSSSEATIRRDLRRLAGEGRLRRVRGGAQAIERPLLAGQPQFLASGEHQREAKRAIARHAASLCEPGEAVIIDGGTTTFAMAEFLTDLGLTVLTNSFPLAQELLLHTNNRVTLPGGEVYRDQQVVVSPYEQPVVESFSARIMFMSAQAVGPHGLMQTDPQLIRGELELIQRADQVVALVDSSKFDVRGSMVACPLSRVSVLITDDRLPQHHRAIVSEAGVKVVLAETAGPVRT